MNLRLSSDLIILDLELSDKNIIELGAVFFDRQGGISNNVFSSLIKCDEPPSNCFVIGKGEISITELTGINWEDVKKAPTFEEAIKKFTEWKNGFSQNVYLASWGVGDVPCLRQNVENLNLDYKFRGSSYDIKSFMVIYSALCRVKSKTTSLRSMMKAWEVKWDDVYGQQHRALADAYNTALLLQKSIKTHSQQLEIIQKSLKKIGG